MSQFHRRATRLRRALAYALATGGLAVTLATPAGAQPLPADDAAYVDATVREAMADGKAPGVALLMSGPAGDYAKAYGLGDRGRRRALSLDDRFRVGSVTKLFTATDVLIQVDCGRLGLDDPIGRYVPGIPNGGLITIRQLLTMRSGLYDYTADPVVQVAMGVLPTYPFTPRSAVSVIKAHRPLFAPGAKYAYANSNYVLLGLVLQAVTGKTAARSITDDVITPLGLTHTTFPTGSSIPAPAARGYMPGILVPSALREYTTFNPGYASTAGAVISTVGDLATLMDAIRRGTLLSPGLHGLQTTSFCSMPYGGEGGPAYGYGYGLMSFGRWLGHDGAIPGFGTAVFYDPQTGAVFSAMENVLNRLEVFSRIFPRVARRLYPDSLASPFAPCAAGTY